MSNLILHEGKLNSTPCEAEYNGKKIDKLDQHLCSLIEKEKLQGASYLLSRYGKVFACKSMGKLNYKQGSPDLMPDSVRKIASATKLFTTVAIMQLIEDGLIYLKQPVCTIIDEFNTPMHSSITIFHLLTHTSGILPDPGYFLEPYPIYRGKYLPDGSWIKAVLQGTLCCPVGEQWNYSSMGFSLLGEIIARISGMSFEDYIIRKIINPLALEKTFFNIPDSLLEEVCIVNEIEESYSKSKSLPGTPPKGGGGLYSTLDDLWKFGQSLLGYGTLNGSEILSRKSVETMTRNHMENIYAFCWGDKIKGIKQGLGVSFDNRDILTPAIYGHEGAGRCGLWLDPQENFLAAFFVPSKLDWVPESIVNVKNIIWSGIL